MNFIKYPSIENHYNEKFLDKINKRYPNLRYFITEKIDGMNVQFVFSDGKLVGIYTRNGQDIFTAKQYSYLYSKLSDIAEYFLSSNLKDYYNFIVYVELYGNNIQKNINYSQSKDKEWSSYVILDIYLGNENRFLSFDEMENLNLPCFAPVYARDLSLNDALKFDVEDTESIRAKVHYGEKNNIPIVEGVIIRPMVETQRSPFDRLIIKYKTNRIREGNNTKKHIPTSKISVEGINNFINKNRISSVLSKESYELPTQMGKLINDVITDAINEYQKLVKKLSDDEIKSVRKTYSRVVSNLIKENNLRNF